MIVFRPCDVFAHCTNTIGSYSCSCFPGYEGDGKTCQGRLLAGFRIRIFFFADPDPGKNLHSDPGPDPDPGGIRGRGLGVKGKMNFFFEFLSRFR